VDDQEQAERFDRRVPPTAFDEEKSVDSDRELHGTPQQVLQIRPGR
jgi:hypothetical protein